MDSKDGPRYVTIEFCDERFGRIMDKLAEIDRKVTELRNEQRQKARDYRLFLLSALSGVVVALVAWLLSHL
jgi:Flp pilus assembly protein TadB